MKWSQHAKTWPNAEHSRFVEVNGTSWHVQTVGEGPHLLLLHGSGATVHSFRHLLPILGEHFTVTTLDLPGHGFTGKLAGGSPTLPRVSAGVASLVRHEKYEPVMIVGHSAGAAISVYLAERKLLSPAAIVSINGAFYPFPGYAAHIFPALAKILFLNPFVPGFFAAGAGNRDRILRLMRSTGSTLDAEGIDLYQQALSSRDHVDGTLAMMANWNLEPMADQLSKLAIPVLQIIGGKDGTVAPDASLKTEKLLQFGSRVELPDYGHLVHEEAPDTVARCILDFARQTSILTF